MKSRHYTKVNRKTDTQKACALWVNFTKLFTVAQSLVLFGFLDPLKLKLNLFRLSSLNHNIKSYSVPALHDYFTHT